MSDASDRPMPPRLRGFLSYSHADLASVERLKVHLLPAARAALGMEFWSDAEIEAGSQWDQAIADTIERANVFVLCMSPDYLASRYRSEVEWPGILASAEKSGGLVVPVILRQCAWWGFVGNFQAVPINRGRLTPVSDWRPRESGYHRAAEQIIEAMRLHFGAGIAPDVGLSRIEKGAIRPVPPAPSGYHKLAAKDIKRTVREAVARLRAESEA